MTRPADTSADVIIVGAGLAGLVAAAELGDRGKSVILVEQEPAHFMGGQAHWSLGGLFMIDTPEQRRMGIRDCTDLARRDWFGSAQFDRAEDHWPQRWARAYLDFASAEMRAWLSGLGMRWFPVVGWAERGGGQCRGAWQLRPPISRHLGHRTRCCRPICRARQGPCRGRADPAAVSPSGEPHHYPGWQDPRGFRRDPRPG